VDAERPHYPRNGSAGLDEPVVLPLGTGMVSNHGKIPQTPFAKILDQALFVTAFALV
jgi:hypothetical protein